MTTTTEGRLELQHTYAHPPERVFDAWTDGEGMSRWMRPGKTTSARARLDVRVGGSYVIDMIVGEDVIRHTGEYTVVDRPNRLAFTWKSRFLDEPSVVTLDFRAVDGGTELTLTHEGLPSESSVKGHTEGWTAILEELAEAL